MHPHNRVKTHLKVSAIKIIAAILLSLQSYAEAGNLQFESDHDTSNFFDQPIIGKFDIPELSDQLSIKWNNQKNGTIVADIKYKANSTSIVFTIEEINAASQGYIDHETIFKIHNSLPKILPGGGGAER